MKKEILNPSGYDMPRPTRFFILDDVSFENPQMRQDLEELRGLIDSRFKARLLALPKLGERLRKRYAQALERKDINPADLIIPLGTAGERVNQILRLKAPQVKVNPTRIAGQNGLPFITSKSGVPLSEEVKAGLSQFSNEFIASVKNIWIVDDTVFFGETIQTVVEILRPYFPKANFTALVLTYVEHFARSKIPQEIKIISGFSIRSNPNLQRGLNSVDAKDFALKDALPLSDGSTIPFMEEDNWMRSWFGGNYEEAYRICQRLEQRERVKS